MIIKVAQFTSEIEKSAGSIGQFRMAQAMGSEGHAGSRGLKVAPDAGKTSPLRSKTVDEMRRAETRAAREKAVETGREARKSVIGRISKAERQASSWLTNKLGLRDVTVNNKTLNQALQFAKRHSAAAGLLGAITAVSGGTYALSQRNKK